MSDIKRGMRVKWPSRYNEHVFNGVVKRVIDDRAIVDDGSGLTFRVVPTSVLIIMSDPTRMTGLRK